MEGMHYPGIPGDPHLIDQIVNQIKSQGTFDQWRRDCLSDVDTKPAYQNLTQRVDNAVAAFLSRQRWRPDIVKNQLRENLRKHILELGFIEKGVDRIVEQVVQPKILPLFRPAVENVIYKFLGIEKPKIKDELHLKEEGKEEEDEKEEEDQEELNESFIDQGASKKETINEHKKPFKPMPVSVSTHMEDDTPPPGEEQFELEAITPSPENPHTAVQKKKSPLKDLHDDVSDVSMEDATKLEDGKDDDVTSYKKEDELEPLEQICSPISQSSSPSNGKAGTKEIAQSPGSGLSAISSGDDLPSTGSPITSDEFATMPSHHEERADSPDSTSSDDFSSPEFEKLDVINVTSSVADMNFDTDEKEDDDLEERENRGNCRENSYQRDSHRKPDDDEGDLGPGNRGLTSQHDTEKISLSLNPESKQQESVGKSHSQSGGKSQSAISIEYTTLESNNPTMKDKRGNQKPDNSKSEESRSKLEQSRSSRSHSKSDRRDKSRKSKKRDRSDRDRDRKSDQKDDSQRRSKHKSDRKNRHSDRSKKNHRSDRDHRKDEDRHRERKRHESEKNKSEHHKSEKNNSNTSTVHPKAHLWRRPANKPKLWGYLVNFSEEVFHELYDGNLSDVSISSISSYDDSDFDSTAIHLSEVEIDSDIEEAVRLTNGKTVYYSNEAEAETVCDSKLGFSENNSENKRIRKLNTRYSDSYVGSEWRKMESIIAKTTPGRNLRTSINNNSNKRKMEIDFLDSGVSGSSPEEDFSDPKKLKGNNDLPSSPESVQSNPIIVSDLDMMKDDSKEVSLNNQNSRTKRSNCIKQPQQRYENTDLYKPRPVITPSSRRTGRNSQTTP